MREQTEAMRLPRFLWVPFELGRPFGAPHEPDFQRRVLHDALALLERTDGPVVLADFTDDAPGSDEEIEWACPISFAARPTEEPALVASVRNEIGGLSPWAELGSTPAPNSGLGLQEIVDHLAALIEETDNGAMDIESFRLIADDLRTWYLHAVSQQPGRATSHDRNTWFWRETALAHVFGHIVARLLDAPNPRVRVFAERGIVPRDHWTLLVPDTTEKDD